MENNTLLLGLQLEQWTQDCQRSISYNPTTKLFGIWYMAILVELPGPGLARWWYCAISIWWLYQVLYDDDYIVSN